LGEFFDLEIKSDHTHLPTKAQKEIFSKTHGGDLTKIVTSNGPNVFILLIKILSPADIVIIAPDGKRVGKNFDTGEEINEIPGAFYSGFETDDEYVTIPDPIDGEYKIETMGTGNGGEYTLVVSNISDNGLVESSFSSTILPNVQKEVSFIVASTTSIMNIYSKEVEGGNFAPSKSISVYNEQKIINNLNESVFVTSVQNQPEPIYNTIETLISTTSISAKKVTTVPPKQAVDVIEKEINIKIDNTASVYNSINQNNNFLEQIKNGVIWVYGIIKKGFLYLIN